MTSPVSRSEKKEMPSDKMISEREAVERERRAVRKAAIVVMGQLRGAVSGWDGGGHVDGCSTTMHRHVARKFVESMDFRGLATDTLGPPPKISRPRTLDDPHSGFEQRWRLNEGTLQWSAHATSNSWKNAELHARSECDSGHDDGCICCISPERLKIFAALALQPDELITDDGSEGA